MADSISLSPLLWPLAGYLLLQILLNFTVAAILSRKQRKPQLALVATFWCGVINALYFLAAAILLRIWDLVPSTGQPSGNYGLWALVGLPAGAVLWFVTTLGGKLGKEMFGKSELIAAEDAILRVPPHPRYIGWGVANLALIQPLGRELFMRAVFFHTVSESLGWPAGLGATLVIELLLRLNVVWLFQTAFYTLALCGMYLLTGNALMGLVAAAVSGLIQAALMIRLGLSRQSPDG